MSLGAVLVDKAKVSRRSKGATVVDGGKLDAAAVVSDTFRCRFMPGPDAETRPDSGQVRQKRPARIIIGLRDSTGQKIDLRAQDEVLLVRKGDGTETRWEVIGDPQPIRKRSSIMGYSANLSRVKRQQTERPVQ